MAARPTMHALAMPLSVLALTAAAMTYVAMAEGYLVVREEFRSG
jgi:hypothetical protein